MVERNLFTNESDRNSLLNPDRSSSISSSQKKNISPDEIILSLANTYENKRARQVTEWERVQAANVRRSA